MRAENCLIPTRQQRRVGYNVFRNPAYAAESGKVERYDTEYECNGVSNLSLSALDGLRVSSGRREICQSEVRE